MNSKFRLMNFLLLKRAGRLITLLLVLCLPQLTMAIKHPNNIKIAINDWSSQIVLSHVMARLFDNWGYTTEFVPIKVNDQWGALSHNIVDLQIEVWQGTMSTASKNFVRTGKIIFAGAHQIRSREDWWYPDYVSKLCPELPNWQALIHCQQVFVDPETGKPTFYSGSWGKEDILRIKALNLPFVVKRVKDSEALWSKLNNAAEQQRGILLLNWYPNWTHARLAGHFVEFPEFSEKCLTQAEWGINPLLTHDCGSPKQGWIKKFVSPALAYQQPCLFSKLKRVSFTEDMMSDAAAFMVVDKLNASKAAFKFIQKYQDKWREWQNLSCDKAINIADRHRN